MIAILLAAILAAPSTPESRLTAYIVKQSKGKATPYALTLARSILSESKRVGIDPAVMVAVMWTESRFDRMVRGSAGEYGPAQLMRSDSRMAKSWATLHPTRPPWRSLSREAMIRALRDIKTSTYLAADELAGVARWCRKARHRIGAQHGPRLWILGSDGVHRLQPRMHRYEIDRWGHHQAGIKWPLPGYLKALRHQFTKAKKVIRGK